jgi:hypothetical protein
MNARFVTSRETVPTATSSRWAHRFRTEDGGVPHGCRTERSSEDLNFFFEKHARVVTSPQSALVTDFSYWANWIRNGDVGVTLGCRFERSTKDLNQDPKANGPPQRSPPATRSGCATTPNPWGWANRPPRIPLLFFSFNFF